MVEAGAVAATVDATAAGPAPPSRLLLLATPAQRLLLDRTRIQGLVFPLMPHLLRSLTQVSRLPRRQTPLLAE